MINLTQVEEVMGVYFYADKPFTGAGFQLRGECLENVCTFQAGVLAGPYTHPHFRVPEGLPYVSADYITFRGEYLDSGAFYQEEAFTGLVCELSDDQGLCEGMHFFAKGHPVSSLTWYPTGEEQSFGSSEEDLAQYFSWFADGTLRAIRLIIRIPYNYQLISLGLSEARLMRSLWIEHDYFAWVQQHGHRLAYHYLSSPVEFAHLKAAPDFALYYEGVDDAVYEALVMGGAFSNLQAIELSNTTVSGLNIYQLASIPTLKKAVFRDKNRDLRIIAQDLKQTRPDCSIICEGQQVAI